MSSILGDLKRLRVKSCFAYHEEKVDDTEIMFGWKPLKLEDMEKPFVVSYGSKAKSVSEKDLEWSKDAGVNAASLKDYNRYFQSLTGDSAEDFLSKWLDNNDELEQVRKTSNPKYRDGEGAFLISLANLLVDGKKFSQYGRIFKIIE